MLVYSIARVLHGNNKCVSVPIPLRVRVPPSRPLLLSRPGPLPVLRFRYGLACALPLRPLYRLHCDVHKFNHAYHMMHCDNCVALTLIQIDSESDQSHCAKSCIS
jgi:hypothetical protein